MIRSLLLAAFLVWAIEPSTLSAQTSTPAALPASQPSLQIKEPIEGETFGTPTSIPTSQPSSLPAIPQTQTSSSQSQVSKASADEAKTLTNNADDTPREFVLSPRGLRTGETVFGLGLGFAFIVPVGELRYLYGLKKKNLAFEGILGVVGFGALGIGGGQLSTGVRRCFCDRNVFSFAVRVGTAVSLSQGNPTPGVALQLGASTGFNVSAGGAKTQLSLNVDASYYLLSGGDVALRQPVFVLLPTLNLERSAFLFRVGAFVFGESNDAIGLPTVAAGVSW